MTASVCSTSHGVFRFFLMLIIPLACWANNDVLDSTTTAPQVLSSSTAAHPTTNNLMRWCYASYILRHYGEFFKCAKQMDSVLTAEPTDAKYYAVLTESMQAEMLLELGQPQPALAHAVKAYESLPLRSRSPKSNRGTEEDGAMFRVFLSGVNELLRDDGKWPAVYQVDEVVASTIGLLARAHLAIGDIRKARYFRTELALFGNQGEREIRYIDFSDGKFAEVVRRRDHKEEESGEIKLTSILMLLNSIAGAVQIASMANNATNAAPSMAAYIRSWENTQLSTLAALSFPTIGASYVSGTSLISSMRAFHDNYGVAIDNYIYGKSLIEVGQLEKASKVLDALIEWKGLEMLGGLYSNVLFERARIYLKEHNDEQAEPLLRKAIYNSEKIRSSISMEASKIGYASSKQGMYGELVTILAKNGDWVGAFEMAERSKSRALVDILAAAATTEVVKLSSPNATEARLLDKITTFDKTTSLLERLNTLPKNEVEGTTLRSARSDLEAAIAELNTNAPEAASLVSVQTATLDVISRTLAPNDVLVSYYQNGERLYAFVVKDAQLSGFILDGKGMDLEIEDLENGIQDYKRKVEKVGKAAQERIPTVDDVARRLFQRLIKPLELASTSKRLIIAPHGRLHHVPFSALNDGNEYLVDRWSIRIVPSAATLVYLKKEKVVKLGQLLVLGNPDLDNPEMDLPAAEEEAYEVGRRVFSSKVLVRKQASKDAVKRYGEQFEMLHVASHGEFDAKEPMRSALLLARDGADDGRLTVGDVYSMRLNSELVTLSGCLTGYGKVNSGDDVIGLTRGFFYAGSRSIISSLWDVADKPTSQMMTNFYTKVGKNSKAEALRLAQIDIRVKWQHPFFWAGFQLNGLGD